MSTIWMILGGCLIGLGIIVLLAAVLLERAAVTSIAGFSKIFADAVKVLSNPEETEDQGE